MVVATCRRGPIVLRISMAIKSRHPNGVHELSGIKRRALANAAAV